MAKRKPAPRPKRKQKDKRSASARPSARSRDNHGPARPKPPAEVRPLEYLFAAKDAETLLGRILDFFTVPRTLGITALLLAILLPLALWIRWDDINKNMGASYFSNQQWELALKSYENHSREDRDAILAATAMARCYLETKQPDKAAERIETARKGLEGASSKRMTEYTNNINTLHGWVLLDTGKTNEALSALNQVLEKNADHPLANYLLARHMLEIKNLRAASAFFQKLSKYPEYASFVEEYKRVLNEKILEIPESELSDLPESTTSTVAKKP